MAKTTLCSCILAVSVLFLTLELCIAQQPRTVPVKVLNSGPNNTCPSESQVIRARDELLNTFTNIGLTEDNPATTLPANNPCNMDATSGNLTGEWMRVAYIDMRNTNHQCPDGLTLSTRSSPPRRVCDITNTINECVSTTFTVRGVEYVYGRIIGYQNGAVPGFYYHSRGIDSSYVYGVSLTHGRSPRKHIWSFAGTRDETPTNERWQCPCSNINLSPPPTVPSFVGNDYFCDTAYRSYTGQGFQSSDPLWDGAGCGSNSTCCCFNHPPWFTKNLPSPTTDDVEMRSCRPAGDGILSIELVELYVQ